MHEMPALPRLRASWVADVIGIRGRACVRVRVPQPSTSERYLSHAFRPSVRLISSPLCASRHKNTKLRLPLMGL